MSEHDQFCSFENELGITKDEFDSIRKDIQFGRISTLVRCEIASDAIHGKQEENCEIYTPKDTQRKK